MVKFPETVEAEWTAVATAAYAGSELRKRISHEAEVERTLDRLRVQHEAKEKFQQELDAETTPTLEMGTLSDYLTNPAQNAPVDLIAGVMKADGLTTVQGPSGAGKSSLALQMVHSLLTGDDWFGAPVTQVAGSVGIVSYDMDAAMVYDWMSGWPGVDTDRISVVNAHKRGNPLNVPSMRAAIASFWKGRNTEIVVIDSFSASFYGHDQNDAASTMAHYRDLMLFALTEVGAKAVIIIVHSTDSNPDKARGSTVHHDVPDSRVVISIESSGARRVKMAKYRDAIGQQMMDPVIVTKPDSVTHLMSLDLGEMSLAGMHLPPSAAAASFTSIPDAVEEPDTESDEEDDDL